MDLRHQPAGERGKMTEAFPTQSWVAEADALLRRLFPICRSITGDGIRETLRLLREVADFDVHEVPSGTACYDWSVPDEWNVRDAFVADSKGMRVIDYKANNVHLVNYSEPFEGTLTFDELAPHLYTLPNLPEAIPYRTSYYNRAWGFCLAHKQFEKLDRREKYRVVVDSTLTPGALTYGEALLPGTSGQEYLISTYCCHPSLGNDNLSGVVLWTLLLRELRARGPWNSYRFVIAPETIGALAYISRNEGAVKKLAGGYIPTTVAGPGKFGYKRTFLGDHLIDRAVHLTFKELDLEFIDYPFDINGSDERQYSTPGLRIPLGTICKDKYYEYAFYHTSLDNLDFIRAEYLIETLKLYLLAIEKLEQNRTYRSTNPIGEPMLGKRGLYPKLGGAIKQKAAEATTHSERDHAVGEGETSYGSELDAIRWLLFYADGQAPLIDIAEKTGLPMRQLHEVAQKLVAGRLLEEAPPSPIGKWVTDQGEEK
jgi:aminopeptidase-like protein